MRVLSWQCLYTLYFLSWHHSIDDPDLCDREPRPDGALLVLVVHDGEEQEVGPLAHAHAQGVVLAHGLDHGKYDCARHFRTKL